MAVALLVVAALCVLAGAVLLGLDRRRRRSGSLPTAGPARQPEDLFTPDALPRHDDG